MRYAFGDSEIAARRLQALARVFAPSSRPFLLHAAPRRPRLAVDLGCGPGHTTHFLAGVLGCDRVAGLDNSERFLALARSTETASVSFHLHDVTEIPFPTAPADLLYSRFLLTHLREPRSVIARWATQLAPRGLLLMEETEWMLTDNPAFATYLEIVEAMLTHQSTTLYVGAVLQEIAATSTLRVRLSQVGRLPVSTRDAAGLFHLNIQTWKRHPFIQAHYPAARIDALEQELAALTQDVGDDAGIEFGLRQVMCERG
jgi:SAM-dependent methyltransferase